MKAVTNQSPLGLLVTHKTRMGVTGRIVVHDVKIQANIPANGCAVRLGDGSITASAYSYWEPVTQEAPWPDVDTDHESGPPGELNGTLNDADLNITRLVAHYRDYGQPPAWFDEQTAEELDLELTGILDTIRTLEPFTAGHGFDGIQKWLETSRAAETFEERFKAEDTGNDRVALNAACSKAMLTLMLFEYLARLNETVMLSQDQRAQQAALRDLISEQEAVKGPFPVTQFPRLLRRVMAGYISLHPTPHNHRAATAVITHINREGH